MSGIDLSSFESLTQNLGSLVPSPQAVVQQVALGAASGVVLAGLKSQMQSGALDPLGLFHNTAPQNNPNAITGSTISQSAFSALNAADKATVLAAGTHIVPG